MEHTLRCGFGEGWGLRMLNKNAILAAVAGVGLTAVLSGCVPVDPFPTTIYVRNGPEALEMLACESATITNISLSRRLDDGESEWVSVFDAHGMWQSGPASPIAVAGIVDASTPPGLIAPLVAGEELSFGLVGTDSDGEFTTSGVITATDDDSAGLAAGLWLNAVDLPAAEPCT